MAGLWARLWRKLWAKSASQPKPPGPAGIQKLENPYHRIYTPQRTLEELAHSAQERGKSKAHQSAWMEDKKN